MIKIKGKLIDSNRIGPLAYSKRTLKRVAEMILPIM